MPNIHKMASVNSEKVYKYSHDTNLKKLLTFVGSLANIHEFITFNVDRTEVHNLKKKVNII